MYLKNKIKKGKKIYKCVCIGLKYICLMYVDYNLGNLFWMVRLNKFYWYRKYVRGGILIFKLYEYVF